jgi:hypothetical protein
MLALTITDRHSIVHRLTILVNYRRSLPTMRQSPAWRGLGGHLDRSLQARRLGADMC